MAWKLFLFLTLGIAPATAAVLISQTLGEQDFANLATATSAPYLAAAGNETSPFSQIFGGDAVSNGSFSWTFNYSPVLQSIGSATVLMALYETESSASGSQIASFLINGIDLTSQMNTLHEATPGASSQIVHYTLVLPSTVFASLATGTVTFSLTLQGPGLGILGETNFNGGGIDFSTLTINDADQGPAIPEPSSLWLLAGGVAVLAARVRMTAR